MLEDRLYYLSNYNSDCKGAGDIKIKALPVVAL